MVIQPHQAFCTSIVPTIPPRNVRLMTPVQDVSRVLEGPRESPGLPRISTKVLPSCRMDVEPQSYHKPAIRGVHRVTSDLPDRRDAVTGR
jgi:hypothetical protein